MRISEPLNGFNISLGYIVIQLGFFLHGLFILFYFDKLVDDSKNILQVTLICFGICIVSELASKVFSKNQKGGKNHIQEIINYIYIFSSSFSIYYIITCDDSFQKAYRDLDCAEFKQLYFCYVDKIYVDSYSQEKQSEQVLYFLFLILFNYVLSFLFAVAFILIQTCRPSYQKIFQKPINQVEVDVNAISNIQERLTESRPPSFKREKNELECLDLLEGAKQLFQKHFLKNGIAVVMSILTTYICSVTLNEIGVYLFLIQALLIFIIFTIDCYDIFSSEILSVRTQWIKATANGLIYVVTGVSLTYYYPGYLEEQFVVWSCIYSYILIVDLFITIYEYRSLQQQGLTFSQIIGQQFYAKIPMSINYERNIELTDDIFCIAYNANYQLSLRRQLQDGKDQTAIGDSNNDSDGEDVSTDTLQEYIGTEKYASSLLGKCFLVFTAQVLMIIFVLRSFTPKTDTSSDTNSGALSLIQFKTLFSVKNSHTSFYQNEDEVDYSVYPYECVRFVRGYWYKYGGNYNWTDDIDYKLCISDEYQLSKGDEGDGTAPVAAASFEILMIRLLCAIFLHLQVLEEMVQSLRMFYFAKNQVKDLTLRNTMISTSLMKFLSALLAEIVNIILISSENSTLDIIKDFVALTIIAELDSIYAKMISKKEKGETISEGKEIVYDESIAENVKQARFYSVWNVIYQILEKFFYSFVFYFMPFSTIYLNLIQIYLKIMGIE